MDEVNYSFIIPHKNIPDLLQRCLDSIPHRKDVQIIVVDDNSDPKKVDFTCFPGVRDQQTEVYFTKEGRGAGYARNVGLSHAKGKWLLFADADDFYAESFLEKLDEYVESSFDIIYFSIYSLESNTLMPSDRDANIDLFFRKYDGSIRSADYVRFKRWGPWNKMIRKSFWQKYNIQFEEIPFGNDMFFMVSLGILTKKIKLLNEKLYCLTYLSSSISYTPRSFDLEILNFKLNSQICKVYDIINRRSWKLIKIYYFYALYRKNGFGYFWGYIYYLLTHYSKVMLLCKEGNKKITELYSRYLIQKVR